MHQGETITTTVSNFPVPVSEIKEFTISFKNKLNTYVTKTLKDCIVSGETLVFELSQAESLSLPVGKIDRSAVIITKDGTRFECCPSPIMCHRTSRDEVIL